MFSMHRARLLLLACLPIGCGPPQATTRTPEDPAPSVAMRSPAAPAPAPTIDAQTISFADDADPEPATQIQGAPKRPPLPRFQLFGTRPNDGPN
jgi:hypothetical protein